MGVGGIFKFVFRRLCELLIIGALLVFIPNLPPQANFSKSISVGPTKPLIGKLSINNRLDDVEIWHKGDFVGPEAFADLNGELYTSLYSGDIVKLTGEHITPVVKFGKPCKQKYEERICGRPLGMEFDKNGYLIAVDSYYGIFRVDVKTGDKVQLVSPNTEIGGRRPKLFNAVVTASNGDIYWTDSTSDFSLEDGMFSILADPSGRLFHYDAKTKKNKVLIDNLHFANGVALSVDEEFVIVAESTHSRVHRYYLKGPKKGTQDIFIDGLPGMPDNLKSDGKGGFFVPLIMSKDNDHPVIFQAILPFPVLRKGVARFFGVAEYLFKKIDEYFPNDFSATLVHKIGHFTTSLPFFELSRTTLLRVDRNGQVIDSVHSLTKKISNIAEMHVLGDTLYLGSPYNDYIARIPLAKLGWDDLKVDRVKRTAPVESPKPTTEAPKPTTTAKPTTTTTPRPTTTTTTPRPTTTTPKPTTTTPKPTTTTPKPTTTTSKPTTTTPKPTTTTTTPKPATTTQKPTQKPAPTTQQAPKPQQATPQAHKNTAQQTPPPTKQSPPTAQQTPPPRETPSQAANNNPPKQPSTAPPVKQAPPPVKEQAPRSTQQQTAPPVKQHAPPPAKQQVPTQQQNAAPKEGAPQEKQAPSKEQPKPAQTNQQPNKK